MKIKIKKKEVIDELSSVSGGDVGGYGANAFTDVEAVKKINDEEEKVSRLDGARLVEMYSTRGIFPYGTVKSVTAEEEFAGARERGIKFQKLQNYKEQMGEDDELDTMDMDSVDREFFDDNPEPLDVDDSTDDEKFKKWVNQQMGNLDLTIGDYLGGGVFGEVYKTDYGVIKIVGVPKSLTAARAKAKNYRPIEDEDVEREVSNYNVVSDAREQDEDIRMHFPEVYSSQVIPYEDGSKIGFIHMEELEPLTSDQVMSVADPAQAVGKMRRDGVFPVKSIVGDYDKDLSKRYIGFLTSEENEKLLKRYVSETSDIYSQVGAEVLQSILKDYDTTKGAALQRIKNIKQKIAEENPENKFIRRTFNQAIRVIELDSKDNHSLMLAFTEMLYAVVASAKENGIEGSKLNRKIDDFTMEWLSSARTYVMMDTKFSKIDDMAADMGLDSLVGRPNARGIIKAIKKLKDLTGLRAVDMHSDNIMARQGQNLVIVDLGLFRKDATAEDTFFNLQETLNFSIKIKRNPRK